MVVARRLKFRPSLFAPRKTRTDENHGSYVYLFNNIQTNQVIYSLTRRLDPQTALEQCVYYGKKTKPAALRKDIWRPMAAAHFQNKEHGLVAYRKLRELRLLRDYAWRDTEPRLLKLRPKDRAKKLMNQKSTSVADLSMVLQKQKIAIRRKRETEEPAPLQARRLMKSRWKNTEELAKQANDGAIGIVETDMNVLQTKLEKQGASPAAIIDALSPLRKKRRKLRQARHAVRVVAEIKAKNTLAGFKWNELPLDKSLIDLAKSVALWQSSSEQQTKLRQEDERLDQEREIKVRLEKTRLEKSEKPPTNPADIAVTKIKLQEWNEWEQKRLEEDQLKREELLERQQRYAARIRKRLERTGRPPTDDQKELILSASRAWIEPPRPSLADVKIYWADQADLELAQDWPAHVRHEWMGILTNNHKYVAPKESQIITELPTPVMRLPGNKATDSQGPIADDGEQDELFHEELETGREGKNLELDNRGEQNPKKSWWQKLPLAMKFKGRS